MITNHPTLDAFHAALDQNSEDWDTRFIMSDWYEEQGDLDTASAIRWQAHNQHCALNLYTDWRWYNINQVRRPNDHPPSDLPTDLFLVMAELSPSSSNTGLPMWLVCASRRLAEETLWLAWPKWKAEKHGSKVDSQELPTPQETGTGI